MGKKKEPQIGIRLPRDLKIRIEKCAELWATDKSNLIRMMIVQSLPDFEKRARVAHGIETTQEGN